MTPKEHILEALYHAQLNAHDMGLKEEAFEDEGLTPDQYAIWCIVEGICEGGPHDFPESAYLECQYDDDDNLVRHTIAELRTALVPALVEFYKSMNARAEE
jgi:hypothetical protein|tara:strand:+ start:3901 stop:4203 length:303 start_codon:yes stop_codon:yes gene_type:complete